MLRFMGLQSRTQLSNRTELNMITLIYNNVFFVFPTKLSFFVNKRNLLK